MKKKRIIMIIDDPAPVIKKLVDLVRELQQAGPFVYAYTFREGVQLLNDEEINLVLLDISVPVNSGTDILQLLKKNEVPATLIIDMSSEKNYDPETEVRLDPTRFFSL